MKSTEEVIVVRTGTANLASVCAGLRRVGAAPRVSDDPRDVAGATRVVLPGVGAFGAAMECLRERGLVDVLRERVAAGRPTLAVCLGMQLLCEHSEETPGVEGLGIVSARVERFTGVPRVPQLGWNLVRADDDCRLLTTGYAYFANSYRLADVPNGWRAARSEYGGTFVAAIERGDVLACQFHPELSGAWGLVLLRCWLDGAAADGGVAC